MSGDAFEITPAPATVWLQSHRRPSTRATQLSRSWILDPQKQRALISDYCCFKSLTFGVICYTATVTGRGTTMESKREGGKMPSPRSNKEILSIHKNHRKEDFKVFKNDQGRYDSPTNAIKTTLEWSIWDFTNYYHWWLPAVPILPLHPVRTNSSRGEATILFPCFPPCACHILWSLHKQTSFKICIPNKWNQHPIRQYFLIPVSFHM